MFPSSIHPQTKNQFYLAFGALLLAYLVSATIIGVDLIPDLGGRHAGRINNRITRTTNGRSGTVVNNTLSTTTSTTTTTMVPTPRFNGFLNLKGRWRKFISTITKIIIYLRTIKSLMHHPFKILFVLFLSTIIGAVLILNRDAPEDLSFAELNLV